MIDERDKFIERWQRIESKIKELSGGGDSTRFRDDLEKLAKNDSLIKKKQGLIEDLYALRNVYSHRDRIKYIAKLENHVDSDIESVIEMLENPPTVKKLFECKVFSINTNDNLLYVMDEMTRNEFTHVPIYDEGIFKGVFTYNSFFEWVHEVLNKKVNATFEKRTVGQVNPRFLNSPIVRYDFVSQDESAGKVLSIFQQSTVSNKRLDCILITTDGKKNSSVIGIITAWDLYKVW